MKKRRRWREKETLRKETSQWLNLVVGYDGFGLSFSRHSGRVLSKCHRALSKEYDDECDGTLLPCRRSYLHPSAFHLRARDRATRRREISLSIADRLNEFQWRRNRVSNRDCGSAARDMRLADSFPCSAGARKAVELCATNCISEKARSASITGKTRSQSLA